MDIEKYEHSKHFELYSGWLNHFSITPNPEYLSDCGLVIDKRAIGFLNKCSNAKVCYINSIAADPNATKEERDSAIYTLLVELEDLAKQDGFKVISTMGNLPSMVGRFTDLNYNKVNLYYLFNKLI